MSFRGSERHFHHTSQQGRQWSNAIQSPPKRKPKAKAKDESLDAANYQRSAPRSLLITRRASSLMP